MVPVTRKNLRKEREEEGQGMGQEWRRDGSGRTRGIKW